MKDIMGNRDVIPELEAMVVDDETKLPENHKEQFEESIRLFKEHIKKLNAQDKNI